MKKTNTYRLFVVLFAVLMTTLTARADDGILVYSGSNGVAANATFGTAKKETYDVAMHVGDPALRGMTIRTVKLHLGDVQHISSLKVWLSRTLTTVKNGTKTENSPDIQQVDVADANGGDVSVALDEPYTIGDDGVYVGYTMTFSQLTEAEKYPVSYARTTEAGNFFLHTSVTYTKWNDLSARGYLPIEVGLAGGEPALAVASGITQQLYGETGKPSTADINLRNRGYEGVNTIGYTYTVGDIHGTSTIQLDTPLPPIFDYEQTVALPLPSVGAKGDYPVSVCVTEINGKPNRQPATLSSLLTVYRHLPRHRALMEEYTGTWCRNCPRGFVGLEIMSRLYPDDFIAISYHNKDSMEIMPREDFPNEVSGFPDGYLDRTYKVDPYSGFANAKFGLDKAWAAVCKLQAPADVPVKAHLSADGSKVEAEGFVRFPIDVTEASYSVELVLVADSLHGVGGRWDQSNVYNTDQPEDYPEPEFDKFVHGSSLVSGLRYNDVAIATSRQDAADVVLPTSFTADEEYPFSYTFLLDGIVSTGGTPLVQDRSHLRVVAVLKDASGKVANASKSDVDASSYSGIATTKTVVEAPSAVYSLAGVKLGGLCKGVNIVRRADGKVVKIMK